MQDSAPPTSSEQRYALLVNNLTFEQMTSMWTYIYQAQRILEYDLQGLPPTNHYDRNLHIIIKPFVTISRSTGGPKWSVDGRPMTSVQSLSGRLRLWVARLCLRPWIKT